MSTPHSTGKATIENPIFSLIEAVCISWFTIEYFLRLAGFVYNHTVFVFVFVFVFVICKKKYTVSQFLICMLFAINIWFVD